MTHSLSEERERLDKTEFGNALCEEIRQSREESEDVTITAQAKKELSAKLTFDLEQLKLMFSRNSS